jgi:hypothetical protein
VDQAGPSTRLFAHWDGAGHRASGRSSPTLAYLAKNFGFIVGGGGIVFFVLAPIVLPLWLIYVFVGSLCGGLSLYVGSLGRI